MRASKQDKALSHARIVSTAATLFREQGLEQTGVAQIMQAAGLTHGGMYRHFESKEALAIAAIADAIGDVTTRYESDVQIHGPKAALDLFIEQYLSEQHMRDAGGGCPIAALGPEVARASKHFRETLAAGQERLVDLISRGLGRGQGTRKMRARQVLSVLVGGLIMARIAADNRQAIEVLEATRRQAGGFL